MAEAQENHQKPDLTVETGNKLDLQNLQTQKKPYMHDSNVIIEADEIETPAGPFSRASTQNRPDKTPDGKKYSLPVDGDDFPQIGEDIPEEVDEMKLSTGHEFERDSEHLKASLDDKSVRGTSPVAFTKEDLEGVSPTVKFPMVDQASDKYTETFGSDNNQKLDEVKSVLKSQTSEKKSNMKSRNGHELLISESSKQKNSTVKIEDLAKDKTPRKMYSSQQKRSQLRVSIATSNDDNELASSINKLKIPTNLPRTSTIKPADLQSLRHSISKLKINEISGTTQYLNPRERAKVAMSFKQKETGGILKHQMSAATLNYRTIDTQSNKRGKRKSPSGSQNSKRLKVQPSLVDIHNLVDIPTVDGQSVNLADDLSIENTREKRFAEKKQLLALKRKETMNYRSLKSSASSAFKLKQQKTAAELVQEFVNYKPDKKYEAIKDKPIMMMNEYELQFQQAQLREQLKQTNKYLNRLVDKQIIKKQVEEGKIKGQRKGLLAGTNIVTKGEDDIQDQVKHAMLLEKECENAKDKEKQLKKEFKELENYFNRIMDPEICEKTKLQLDYLDEMIKQEYIVQKKLNAQQKKFMRLDFIQKEVDVERKLVNIEDELNRVKLRIDIINKQSRKNISDTENNLTRNDKLLVEKELLEEQIEELNIDLGKKPKLTSKEKKVKLEFDKVQEQINSINKTIQATKTIQNLKLSRFKQKEKQVKEEKSKVQKKINQLTKKIKYQELQIKLTEEERKNIAKMKKTLQIKELTRRVTQNLDKSIVVSASAQDLQMPNRSLIMSDRDEVKISDDGGSPKQVNLMVRRGSVTSVRSMKSAPQTPKHVSRKNSKASITEGNQNADLDLTKPQNEPPQQTPVKKMSLKLAKKESMESVEDDKMRPISHGMLSKKEQRELTQLRRRYGWQPNMIKQKKKRHELVDDRESSPRLFQSLKKEISQQIKMKHEHRPPSQWGRTTPVKRTPKALAYSLSQDRGIGMPSLSSQGREGSPSQLAGVKLRSKLPDINKKGRKSRESSPLRQSKQYVQQYFTQTPQADDSQSFFSRRKNSQGLRSGSRGR